MKKRDRLAIWLQSHPLLALPSSTIIMWLIASARSSMKENDPDLKEEEFTNEQYVLGAKINSSHNMYFLFL